MLNDSDRAWLEEVEARYRAAAKPFPTDRELQRYADQYCTDIPRLIAMVRAGEVHAYWIHDKQFGPYCSNCHDEAPFDCEGKRKYESGFCKNCGAKMDGQRAGEELTDAAD